MYFLDAPPPQGRCISMYSLIFAHGMLDDSEQRRCARLHAAGLPRRMLGRSMHVFGSSWAHGGAPGTAVCTCSDRRAGGGRRRGCAGRIEVSLAGPGPGMPLPPFSARLARVRSTLALAAAPRGAKGMSVFAQNRFVVSSITYRAASKRARLPVVQSTLHAAVCARERRVRPRAGGPGRSQSGRGSFIVGCPGAGRS